MFVCLCVCLFVCLFVCLCVCGGGGGGKLAHFRTSEELLDAAAVGSLRDTGEEQVLGLYFIKEHLLRLLLPGYTEKL